MEAIYCANWFSEDIVGSLLPLLDTTDVKNFLLSCKAFNTAARRQLRQLSPLYVPISTSATGWDSLEHLQLSLSRTSISNCCGNNVRACSFSSAAPLRTFYNIKRFHHAAHVDFSGQKLPVYALELLSRHLTRLKSLKLDACQLATAALLDVTGFTTLRSLSICGVQLRGALPAVNPVAGKHLSTSSSSLQEPAGAVAANAVHADQQQGRLLDAICHLQQLQELRMDAPTYVQAMWPWLVPRTLNDELSLGYCTHKLSSLTNLTALSLLGNQLSSKGWESLCNSIGHQLKELHIHWGTVSVNPWDEPEIGLDPESFLAIRKMTQLSCLTLEVSKMLRFEPYTLTPLAGSLTELRLRGPACLPLLLSLTECSKVVRLELSGLKAAAQPELLLQIVSSMPFLESLSINNLPPPYKRVQPIADHLLPQLNNFCPRLTELKMPDLELNGTGLRLVSTAAADGLSATSASGGVRSCRHLQLCATHMMRSAFPHLSTLSGLQNLMLYGMAQKQFPHLCKLNCFKTLPRLTNLTSLSILPVLDELAHEQLKLQAQFAAADGGAGAQQPVAAAAAAGGGGGEGVGDAGVAADGDGGMMLGMGSEDDDNEEEEEESEDDDMDEEDFEDDEEMQSDDDQQAAEDEETEQSDDEISDDDQMVEDDHDDDDEDDVDQQQLENAQQAAAEAVIDLAQEFQHQAGILAMDPAQQVLAGGAFQQVVAQVLLPALAHLHGPGAADAAAAVAPVQEVAAELAQGAIPWLNPAGAVAALQNALHAAAAGQQQQQQQQQAPVIPYAGMYGLRHHPFEPHLHFLGSMTQLVNLELCCLQTTGLCFLHLSGLQSLQGLALGGTITLNSDSWRWMGQLQLSGVSCLSLTGCTIATDAADAAAGGSVATTGRHEAGSSSSSSRAAQQLSDFCSGMVRLVQALCWSFPGVVNLELGSCRFMTADALVQLGLGLPKLERLRLLGVHNTVLYISKELKVAGSAGGDTSLTSGSLKRKLKPADAGARGLDSSISVMDDAPKLQGGDESNYTETQLAMERLSNLAQSGVGATDLKFVEVCQSEMPHGLIAASSGLHNVSRFRAASKSFVRYEGRLMAC